MLRAAHICFQKIGAWLGRSVATCVTWIEAHVCIGGKETSRHREPPGGRQSTRGQHLYRSTDRLHGGLLCSARWVPTAVAVGRNKGINKGLTFKAVPFKTLSLHHHSPASHLYNGIENNIGASNIFGIFIKRTEIQVLNVPSVFHRSTKVQDLQTESYGSL